MNMHENTSCWNLCMEEKSIDNMTFVEYSELQEIILKDCVLVGDSIFRNNSKLYKITLLNCKPYYVNPSIFCKHKSIRVVSLDNMELSVGCRLYIPRLSMFDAPVVDSELENELKCMNVHINKFVWGDS